MKAADSLAAGAKYWTCRCGQGNSLMLARCVGCGAARNAIFPGEYKTHAEVHGKPKRKGSRKLRTFREPNQTERNYGLILESMKQRGVIEYYGFEEITLRWADMEYTPDYFVIQRRQPVTFDEATMTAETFVRYMIEAVYIEVKGSYRHEDSVIKFKAARDKFRWARFEMHQCVDGRWEMVA